MHIYLNVIETTVTGYECGDFLAVLDELDTHTLTDGRVRLLSLYSSGTLDLSIMHKTTWQ